MANGSRNLTILVLRVVDFSTIPRICWRTLPSSRSSSFTPLARRGVSTRNGKRTRLFAPPSSTPRRCPPRVFPRPRPRGRRLPRLRHPNPPRTRPRCPAWCAPATRNGKRALCEVLDRRRAVTENFDESFQKRSQVGTTRSPSGGFFLGTTPEGSNFDKPMCKRDPTLPKPRTSYHRFHGKEVTLSPNLH